MHSFTVDRGTEFSGLVSLESQYGIKTYYCHAYTPAERGSNERFNRNLVDCKINPNAVRTKKISFL
ncbi:Mobile element protein [Lactiplantibacillus plantarum]|nr:Mobile element protein [Lactiplantibacillus plantarum]